MDEFLKQRQFREVEKILVQQYNEKKNANKLIFVFPGCKCTMKK